MPRVVFGFVLLALLGAPAALAAPQFDAGNAAVVQMNRLPTWVQVTTPSAPLFTTDTSGDAVAARLAGFAFLRVVGAGAARLQVDAYDDSGNQGQRGWVDPTDVLPSASGTDWLVAAHPATLWMGSPAGAAAVRTLDTFTPLQQIDGPIQNRIEVRVYRLDFSLLDQGWVDAADTGPAFPPQTLVAAPAPDQAVGQHGQFGASQEQAFLNATAPIARAAAGQTGVPASVTVAQAILESDWGRSQLALLANNFFGIKATSYLGNDGLVWMPTAEYDPAGEAYDTITPFRAYKSLTDSVTDHNQLLLARRYAEAMQVANDPRQFAQQLSAAGYSTDPAYADKLIALMDSYNLYRLDA